MVGDAIHGAAGLYHHLSTTLNIYIWVRSRKWLKCGSGFQKSNLEKKVCESGAPANGTFTLYTAEESVISFQTLTFIDLRVIAQHTEEALKTLLMPSGVNSTLTHLPATHPFFLISTDMFEAHVLGVDRCGVRGINSSGVRLNRPHMATKHTHPEIHR